MPSQFWTAALVTAKKSGAAYSNSVAETSILDTGDRFTLPANFFENAGKKLSISASGRISNIVTTPGTLTFKVKYGSIAIATSPAFSLNAVAKTNVTWILEWELTCFTVGNGTLAAVMHTGTWTSESAVGAAAGATTTLAIPASAPAVGTGFDSTVSGLLDLTTTFSIANAGNAMQLHQFEASSRN